MDNTFQCHLCRETFGKAWTDEEALEELNRDFPGYKPEECVILCDDCHKLVAKEVEDGTIPS